MAFKKYYLQAIFLVLAIVTLFNNVSIELPVIGSSILAGLIFISFISSKKRKKLILGSIFIVIMTLNTLYIYREYSDNSVFKINNLEKHEIESRREYMRVGLMGQIYGRKIGNYYFEKVMVYKMKALRKIAIPLDISRYFFSGQKAIFSYWVMPLFIIGFFYLIKEKLGELLLYSVLVMPVSIFIVANKTVYLYLPILIVSSAIGLSIFYNSIQKKFRLFKTGIN